ncbi:putative disease resistance RPP13-like protein 1 [Phaseolus vulgaris]|uniref:putative disease resistance RPP13-like protein 1 n=1 Tax=Phaseolus vulgaris TaxID=3885 RepID=UPI0035CBBC51
MGTSLRKAHVLLGKLKNLQVWISKFEVGKSSSEFSVQQLGDLDLHGKLSIQNLQTIVNPCDALTADLKNKVHLVGLDLKWNLKLNNDESVKERGLLENLQPSNHLEHLSISDYCGTQFPRWLSDKFLLNVVSLNLYNCKHCQWLPSLGLFTFLKQLKIDGLDEIVRIDANFYGNSSPAFASLETLSFHGMKGLEEWQCMKGAFPGLQGLSVTDCPKLKGHLPEHLPHLKNLIIKGCKQLGASTLRVVEIEAMNMETSSFYMIGHLRLDTPLESLTIFSCPTVNIPINHCYHFLVELELNECCDSLTNFPLDLFPKLSNLCLSRCRNLQTISQRHHHSHLKHLIINVCYEFESFSHEGLFAPQLGIFHIEGLLKLKSMPKHMSALLPSLRYLYIKDCPGVELSDECLPSNLKELHLLNCSKLVISLKKGVWGTNPSLKSLCIEKVGVECFSGEETGLQVSLSPLLSSDNVYS